MNLYIKKKKYSFALRHINISLFLCSGGFCVSATETTLALWGRMRQPERAFYVFKKPSFFFLPSGLVTRKLLMNESKVEDVISICDSELNDKASLAPVSVMKH